MTKKKVLLVSLRSPFLDNDRVYPPMGLLYLSAALKERGHEADIEDDFNGENRRIQNYTRYDFVGVSVATPQKKQAEEILKKQKKENKDQILILGGAHATFYHMDAESEPWDYIVRGDGERTLVDIVEGKKVDRVSRGLVKNGEDFDSLPRPDRLGNKQLVLDYFHNFGTPSRRATTFLSGRGCPMACKFCEGAKTPVRWTSMEKAMKELDDIQEFGFNGIYVIDDLFTISENKNRPYVQEFKRRDLIYRVNAHIKFMTPSFADLLTETGCVEVGVGIESGSQKVLDYVDKKIKIQQAYKFIEMMKDRNIRVRGFFMLGLPGESRETIAETESFIRQSGLDDFQITIYAPYRGTMIRDSIESGDKDIDLFVENEPQAHTLSAGRAESNIRTRALSATEILTERVRLIETYKPASHTVSRQDPRYSRTKLE